MDDPSKKRLKVSAVRDDDGGERPWVEKAVTSPPLPVDVIEQILLRLPAPALWRFRLVCRTWRSVIDDQRFVSMHLVRLRESSHSSFLLRRRGIIGAAPVRFTRTYKDDGEREAVVRIPYFLSKSLSLCVGNLVTGEFVDLPSISDCLVVLICQLLQDGRGHHKVLLVYQTFSGTTTSLIFTLGTDLAWRVFPCSHVCFGWSTYTVSFPYLNGAYHCVYDDSRAYERLIRGRIEPFRFVAAFNMNAETVGEIQYPQNCCPSRVEGNASPSYYHSTDLVEWKLKLCLLHFDPQMKFLDAWFLEDYSNHMWRKDHSIDFSYIQREFPFTFHKKEYLPYAGEGVRALAKWRGDGGHDDEEEVLLNYDVRLGGAERCMVYLSYQPEKKSITRVRLELGFITDFGSHVDSLVRVCTPPKEDVNSFTMTLLLKGKNSRAVTSTIANPWRMAPFDSFGPL